MSALRDEWETLMKTRATGKVGENRMEDLRNRLQVQFQNKVRDTVPTHFFRRDSPSVKINQDIQKLRDQIQSTFAGRDVKESFTDPSSKKFTFGLSVKPTQSPLPKSQQENLRPIPPARSDPDQPFKSIDDIAQLQDDTAKNIVNYREPVEDRFEINSIASRSSTLSKHTEISDKEISFFAELSPVARFMANMTREEEHDLYYANNYLHKELQVTPHMVQLDVNKLSSDKPLFQDIANIVMGRVPRRVIMQHMFHILPEESNSTTAILAQNDVSHSYISHYTEDVALPSYRHTPEPKPSHSVPLLQKQNEQEIYEELEKINKDEKDIVEPQLEELLELLKKPKNLEMDKELETKLNKLIEETNQELHNDPYNSNILKKKLLLQFLLEFKNAREIQQGNKKQKLKPSIPKTKRSVPKQSPQKVAQGHDAVYTSSDYLYNTESSPPLFTNVMREGWSTNSKPSQLNAKYAPIKKNLKGQKSQPLPYDRHPSKSKSLYRPRNPNQVSKAPESPPKAAWIGGNKHKDEFEDESSWISSENPNQKKTKKPNLDSFGQYSPGFFETIDLPPSVHHQSVEDKWGSEQFTSPKSQRGENQFTIGIDDDSFENEYI